MHLAALVIGDPLGIELSLPRVICAAFIYPDSSFVVELDRKQKADLWKQYDVDVGSQKRWDLLYEMA